jgi:hypothetical protein
VRTAATPPQCAPEGRGYFAVKQTALKPLALSDDTSEPYACAQNRLPCTPPVLVDAVTPWQFLPLQVLVYG